MPAVPAVPATDQALFDRADLEVLADLVIVDPAAAGMALPLLRRHRNPVARRAGSSSGPRDLPVPAAEADHAWLVFDCGPWRVQRWVEIKEKPEGQDQ